MKTALFICGLAAWLFGGNMATELFDEGNTLYEKGQYDSCAAVYEKVLSMGYHDARVYYNLGNAHFRQKQIGAAILDYEKAKLLDPADRDAQNNLQFARAATLDKIVPPEEGFFARILSSLHNALSVSAQAALVLAFLYLFSFLLILHFLAGGRAREFTRPAALVLFILFVPLAVSFSIKVSQEGTTREAVVLLNQVNAVNEPDGSQTLFTVHEGTKFRLHRKVGAWYFASLENGLSGWVNESDLGVIEINE
jgi:tetratricopeptide (TPR) repeat protein